MSHVMNTYGRLPISFERGEGVWLWDAHGKRYLDALAGVAVNAIGHSHPRLVAALRDQVGKLIHTSNYYHIPHQETLAAQLVALSGMTNVFFCSTGLEANEAALKLARKFGHERGITRPQIVVYENAFHGRSIATLSATGQLTIVDRDAGESAFVAQAGTAGTLGVGGHGSISNTFNSNGGGGKGGGPDYSDQRPLVRIVCDGDRYRLSGLGASGLGNYKGYAVKKVGVMIKKV